jgi:hypothetical protein
VVEALLVDMQGMVMVMTMMTRMEVGMRVKAGLLVVREGE